ncbi:hypothetical protein, partial [Alistipes onderdonkii]|uniref:hypothetical protein n=1 Tax=Alistipes onderdonkii TaxID=328813 RepID=UPI0032BFF5E8
TANSYDGKGSHRIFIPYFQLLIQINIKNKASPKHPQPETHCASSRIGGYILARNPKIFKTH